MNGIIEVRVAVLVWLYVYGALCVGPMVAVAAIGMLNVSDRRNRWAVAIFAMIACPAVIMLAPVACIVQVLAAALNSHGEKP